MRLGDDVTELNLSEKCTNSPNKVYEKVIDIMKGLAPIITDKSSPTPDQEAFDALYQIVVLLSHVVFEGFGTIDRIANENR